MTDDEVLVAQVDEDAETLTQAIDDRIRASTSSDWPPEPQPPAELETSFAEGTRPQARHAGIYAAVRRPTTSGDLT